MHVLIYRKFKAWKTIAARTNGTLGRPCEYVLLIATVLYDRTPCLRQYYNSSSAAWKYMECRGGAFQKDYAADLRKFCINNNLNTQIHFLPQLKREQLARFFQVHHVCAFTSLHPEAFGIVAAEAMASGLALVSTGVGGASEVFEDEISGLRYPAGNSSALAEQLERLARDPALLHKLQRTGELRVRTKFCVESSANQIEKLFLELR